MIKQDYEGIGKDSKTTTCGRHRLLLFLVRVSILVCPRTGSDLARLAGTTALILISTKREAGLALSIPLHVDEASALKSPQAKNEPKDLKLAATFFALPESIA